MISSYLVIVAFFLSRGETLTFQNLLKQDEPKSDFLEEASNDIATGVLQATERNNTNFVFSPFGYSVILAMLAEGAEGRTKDELVATLGLPDETKLVRLTFKETLLRMKGEPGTENIPEFKTYFYVYKNFTVEQSYKDVMLENYLTDVKVVERPDFLDDEEPSSTTPKIEVSSKSTREVVREGKNFKLRMRIKRMAKRFLQIDLGKAPKSEVIGLSANRILSARYVGAEHLSRMLIFNGLYFKGSWEIPFKSKEVDDNFYVSETEKKLTKMIYSVGKFQIGKVPQLDSSVVRIPYKGGRYSFVIVVPNSRNGLTKLIRSITGHSLGGVFQNLEEKYLQLSLPSFNFRTISHLKESLKKYGVSSVFTKDANLSGLSPDSGLFVDDLVQTVTVTVDNEGASPHLLTASSVQTRTVNEKFTIDHPFLFFIQDHKDNLIIAAGKVTDPTYHED